uniref:Uncharacterized protein n=1 Tax=Triticum urartu TaxID=4572 RepID=A0A8R7QKS6_TRIUA
MSSFGFVRIFVTQSVEISRDRKFSRPWHHERVQFDLAQSSRSPMVCASGLLARVDVRSRKWAGPQCSIQEVLAHAG